MNIVLWILQALMAMHTAMGAKWKFSHAEKMLPSLRAIPPVAWRALGILEMFLSLCLVLPGFYAPLYIFVPIAALCIAAEMLVFCGVQLRSGVGKSHSLIYWLVVAVLCAFIAYGRFVLSPF